MSDRPDLDKFAFEIEGASGGFILGRSRIGDGLTSAGLVWLPYTAKITTVDVVRDASGGPLQSTPSVGTLNVVLYDENDAEDYANDLNLRTNVAVRLTYNGQPIFTGWIRDVDFDPQRDGGTVVTVQAVDAVGPLANTMRNGAAPLGGSETYTARVRRVTENANVLLDLPADPATTTLPIAPTGWTTFGVTGAGIASGTLYLLTTGDFAGGVRYEYAKYSSIEVASTGGSGTWTIPAYTMGAQTTVTALTVGKVYRLVGLFGMFKEGGPRAVAVGISGKGWGPAFELPTVDRNERELEYVFTATSTSHVVRIAWAVSWTGPRSGGSNGTQNINWRNLVVEEYQPSNAYRLRNIARETSVAGHMSIASDSVGAFWWPTRQGPVKARDTLDAVTRLSLSDAVANASYTHLALAKTTRDVVNTWAVTNLGRDEITGNTADETMTVNDDESVATYGARSANVETSLDVRGWRSEDLVRRIRELLVRSAFTELSASGVTLLGTDNPDGIVQLDLNDRATVTRSGRPYTGRLNKIVHRITAQKWIVELGLRKD